MLAEKLQQILDHPALTVFPLRIRKVGIKDTPEWEEWLDGIMEVFADVAEYFKEYDTIEPWLIARAMRLPESIKLRNKIERLKSAMNKNRPKRVKKKANEQKTEVRDQGNEEVPE